MIKKSLYVCKYIFLLIREVIMANVAVAKIVLSPKMEISPEIVEFESRLKSEFLRVVLANSITLTPGTITIDMQDGMYTVHCLKEEFARGLFDSEFEKILLKIEGE
ncbi:multicomponent Na+:H+ antiporter subunit E [Peptoclostridium litorale DSM 5388]|uniref:Sodium/proton antiporter ShaE n=1 Tax=Peptoclostridium litorale DSM 5388 TaxID=1121324 RepID=A0A069RC15_PEPLI|nr:Na+/H+ antiporter subunit E [Peptoclostridium litorale]KDR94576.1 sodium/proton antiporter ShaE [Peptoclostridium litorale DSM 5388]SIO31622.1 multicomponent Na+:H+ antiporter subunit E [Peptoclostridium litorale DSM 5388]